MLHMTALFGLIMALISPTVADSTTVAPAVAVESSEHQCLALNVYWEARSESDMGRQAVAAVTLNRVENSAFPDSVCAVVTQGGERRNRCQFSWWCDGKSDQPKNAEAWTEARQVAWAALNEDLSDPTGGALFYHASYVKPSWAKRMAKIGEHIFFADPRLQRLQARAAKNGTLIASLN